MKRAGRRKYLSANFIGAFLIVGMLLLSGYEVQATDGVQGEQTKEELEVLKKQEEAELVAKYRDYLSRIESVTRQSEIEEKGFWLIEKQIFPMETECFGQVFLLPAIDKTHHRLVLFFAKEDGSIVYRTQQLEVNNWKEGQLWQPVRRISAVSFQELNGDGRTDIVLIITCVNRDGAYKGKEYTVGEVLFQGENGFFRDYRISDKINRFGMNKSVESITDFVRGSDSTEFLYTSDTKSELLEKGFVISTDQYYTRQFEKMGTLEVVPGTYTMAEFSHFMVYLINEQGNIVWSLQPMGSYDNLYALKGIKCVDMDGDGMKDILVLARYSYADRNNMPVIESDYAVYYQRTGSFEEDEEIKKTVKCSDEDTVAGMVEKVRAYWGWSET